MAIAATAGQDQPVARSLVPMLAVIGAALLAWAASIVAGGMVDLRWAYLYRERTHEGNALAQVGFRLIGGGLVALAGVSAFGVSARLTRGRIRLAFVIASAIILASVTACALVALWVSSQTGCIGPCG